jgi:hypothetical protein
MRQNSLEACLPRAVEQNRGGLLLNVPRKVPEVHDNVTLSIWYSSVKRGPTGLFFSLA